MVGVYAEVVDPLEWLGFMRTALVMRWSERRLCILQREARTILQHPFVSGIHFELARLHLFHFLRYDGSLSSACWGRGRLSS